MKNSFAKLGFAIQVLFITNVWIFLYVKILTYLRASFPVSPQQQFVWVPSVPEPFEIPLYLVLSLGFVLMIFFSQKLFERLNRLPLLIKILLIFLLSLIFISQLGRYPMGGEYDPYPPRPNSLIYFIVGFLYLAVLGLAIVMSRYLNRIYLFWAIVFVLALVTFDARFPMAGHDYEYFIGPSYEVAQGKTLYTDILSRYAFLTPIIFAILNRLSHFSLFYIPFVVWFLYICQYFICFFLLIKISKSAPFALLGTFSLMTVNYFSLSHLPSVIPQVGPLRWFPSILLLFLFYKLKDLESKKFIAAISFLSFFTIDVGIAILLAYGVTLFMLMLQGAINFRRIVRAIILLAINLIAIILFIDILHLVFGYKSVDILTSLYSFRKHAILGLSMIPIVEKTYFWFVLLIYFASVIYFFRNVFSPSNISHLKSNILLLFSANLSLFASVYFVGRSHPHNLFNISLFPILNVFLLFGLNFKKLQTSNLKLLTSIFLFIVFIALPTYQRRITLTEMLSTKYTRLTGGKIFQSEVDEIINTKYREDMKLIKSNLPDDAIILSADDAYLFYSSGKKNLLDANPILGIDLPEDLDFALKNAVKNCPQKIAIDCSFAGKCPSYTPFVGVSFDLKLILDKLEAGCSSKYKPEVCSTHLCIATKQKI